MPLWKSISRFSNDEQTIVVVPSLDVDMELTGSEMQAYEERMLLLLLLLRQPCARLVYVTSQAISPVIIDYYLDLMPGVIGSHARRRLFRASPLRETSPSPSWPATRSNRPSFVSSLRTTMRGRPAWSCSSTGASTRTRRRPRTRPAPAWRAG